MLAALLSLMLSFALAFHSFPLHHHGKPVEATVAATSSHRVASRTSTSNCNRCYGSIARVALTRELGANDKLRGLLSGIDCVELPCLSFVDGEDLPSLPMSISKFDIIVLTSPQAARVFIHAWKQIGMPSVKIATVGKGTSAVLIKHGVSPAFEPSDATGESLAAELPESLGKSVLYPSSSIADNKLVVGLEKRGFAVKRLNTYNTSPSSWTTEQHELAKAMPVVTFASPSTVKIWTERVGNQALAVVIGPTSAKSARELGYTRIYCPEGSKGLVPWAALVRRAVEDYNASTT